jgi:hypothetical protein
MTLFFALGGFYTGDDQQIQIGIIFLVAKVFLGIHNTSVDALALK